MVANDSLRIDGMWDIAKALRPYGYEWLLSCTGIVGPGNMVVIFAGAGDFYVASVTYDNQVVWVMNCGGSDASDVEEAVALHRLTRDRYRLKSQSAGEVAPGAEKGTMILAQCREAGSCQHIECVCDDDPAAPVAEQREVK